MEPRPATFIVRLWSRSDGFRAEVKALHGSDVYYFNSAAELIEFFEKQPRQKADLDGLEA